MTSIVVDGTTYCDDNSCANTMLGKGYATHFFPMVADVLARVVDAETAATSAQTYAAGLTATSTTSTAVGAGSKTLTVEAAKQFTAGCKVIIARTSAPTTTWLYGEVTSYSGTSLVVNVTDYLGSGTYTDWTISIAGIKGASGTSGASLTRSALSGAATLGASDNAKYVEMTGTWTLGFSACATLAAGWWCVLVNAGTGLITVDPNSTEQIDGVTSFVMYPSESRLVVCSGSALYTQVLNPFHHTFTASGSLVVPPGYQGVGTTLIGGGKGGNCGARVASGNVAGGAGGVGGTAALATFTTTTGETLTVTIGAGGAGASGLTSVGSSVAGTAGGTTEITASASVIIETGTTTEDGAMLGPGIVGRRVLSMLESDSSVHNGALGGTGGTGTTGAAAGGAGYSTGSLSAFAGFAGAGGGAGGGYNTTTAYAGGAGGKIGTVGTGGGGTGGTASGGTGGTAADAAGGGGGGSATGAGGTGGAGTGYGCGGGGGGGTSGAYTSGAGGLGANGVAHLWGIV